MTHDSLQEGNYRIDFFRRNDELNTLDDWRPWRERPLALEREKDR